MKVLHVCNTAGVGSIIAKFMDRLFGTESLVVQRRIFDPYGLTTYGEVWDCGPKMFALRCLWLARKFDIVHVHSFDKLVPFLKLIYPHKPVIIHYHGSDIRGKWDLKQKYWSRADSLLYSVKDVEDSRMPSNEAVWLPNPIDIELFRPLGIKRKPRSALSINNYLDKEKALKFAENYGLKLNIQYTLIPYREMPRLLNKFEFYIDCKTTGFSTSKTALEALACGTKVINYYGMVLDTLPEKHKPENVCKKLIRIYQELV